jgi:hypothetical protein
LPEPRFRYRFWADSNQRLFEEALDRAGVRHETGTSFDEVLVEADQADPQWLDDLARELGATRLDDAGEPG